MKEVAMSQHRAFGPAGRSGGVDDHGQIIRRRESSVRRRRVHGIIVPFIESREIFDHPHG
jgi:hypothetical protein